MLIYLYKKKIEVNNYINGICMAKKYPQFPLKIAPNYLDKMKYIANENRRSTNKEIEQLIIRYIKEYEKAYGEIEKEDLEHFFKFLRSAE